MHATPALISPFAQAQPTAANPSAESGSSAKASTSNIGANDFLELLVTEMKNQDPTANQDPNEYINQLVQVNSLEQLIQINEELGGGSGSAGTSASPAVSRPLSPASSPPDVAPGNLSAPAGGGAPSRLAHAIQLPRSVDVAPDRLPALLTQATSNATINPVR